jgi:hypothetical protein
MEWIAEFFDISIDRANQFYTWGWRASVLGAVITMCGVGFLWLGTRVRDINFERSMATLNSEAGAARERAGQFEERAAGLEKNAEELRRQNLELESAVAPRLLQQLPAGEPLRQFAGMQVFISAVPEFEARRFAGYMFVMLQMVDWKPQWLQLDANIMDGVEIEFEGGLRYDPNFPGDLMKAETNTNQLQENAAHALLDVLKKQEIEAKVQRLPFSRTDRPRRPGVPPDAISIRVGAKPIQYFMDQRFPGHKERREEIEKIIEGAKARANERR